MDDIDKPKYTQVPNAILDNTELSHVEFRLASIIARQTFGWHKDTDRISISQFQKKGNMSRSTVAITLKSLEKKGAICCDRSKSINSYRIKIVRQKDQSKPASTINGLASTINGLASGPLNGHTKETINKLNKRKKGLRNYEYIIDFFNRSTNSRITLTTARQVQIQKTVAEHSFKSLLYCIINLSRDDWSKEKKQVRIDRLISPQRRDRNFEQFAHFPYKKKRHKKPSAAQQKEDEFMRKYATK